MLRPVYRFLLILSILSLLLGGVAAPASATSWREKVDPWVLQTAAEGDTEFLVSLASQADLSAAQELPTKSEKGWYVYRTLTSLSERTQAPIIAELERLGLDYQPYWITNAIWVRGSLDAIRVLAERTEVAHLYANPSVKLDVFVADSSPDAGPQGIEWNIAKVNAPDVWALGYTGQGVVIGGADTGYDWDHPAIKDQYRGWDGDQVDHDYNWFDATADDSPVPIDPYGHGTHTMGTMVGDDGGANQIGMAPGARWIGCRNMDAGGNGTPQTYIDCYQWFIAPTRVDGSDPNPDLAPDVINNSWYCPPSEGCTEDDVLLGVVQNLVAAGIVSAHSAGNDGYSGCSSIQYPAAIYDESFTVGATNSNDQIAGFSSRGPVTADGSDRMKPDISAPGVNVRSCVPGGGYAPMSGTSMAGPHVAGLVALLISAHPGLRGQVDQIETTIEQSALGITTNEGCGGDQPGDIPNNTYGWGRIDALAAVDPFGVLEISKTASASSVYPGDLITYTLTITHSNGLDPTTNVVLTDTIPSGSTFVYATPPYQQTGDVLSWSFSSLDAMEAVSVDLIVSVDITTSGWITNDEYAVHSDQVSQVWGEPVTTQIEKLNMLQLSKAASADLAFQGDLITYTLTVTNFHTIIPATNVLLSDVLPAGSTFVSATPSYTRDGNTIQWSIPAMDPFSAINTILVVRVDSTNSGLLINADYSVISDQAMMILGDPLRTTVGRSYFLPQVAKSP
jgi:serine protease AprX